MFMEKTWKFFYVNEIIHVGSVGTENLEVPGMYCNFWYSIFLPEEIYGGAIVTDDFAGEEQQKQLGRSH